LLWPSSVNTDPSLNSSGKRAVPRPDHDHDAGIAGTDAVHASHVGIVLFGFSGAVGAISDAVSGVIEPKGCTAVVWGSTGTPSSDGYAGTVSSPNKSFLIIVNHLILVLLIVSKK
jgi:hypothetical protein